MPRFYLATSLGNREVALDVIRRLQDLGWTLTFDWASRPPVDHHDEEALYARGLDDAEGVAHADVLVAILPGGAGTHVEIGMAMGRGIPVILWAPGGLQVAHGSARPSLWARVYPHLPPALQRAVRPPRGVYPCVFHRLVDAVESRPQVEHLISTCMLWAAVRHRHNWIPAPDDRPTGGIDHAI